MSNVKFNKKSIGSALTLAKSIAYKTSLAPVIAFAVSTPVAFGLSALTHDSFKDSTEDSLREILAVKSRNARTNYELNEMKLGLLKAHATATDGLNTCHADISGFHLPWICF